jgi:hypothetical protein
MASSRLYFGRTPRNSAASPRPGFKSTITAGRRLSRAISTPQFTATVVVPAPPFAPKNTSVVAFGLAPCADSRRVTARRMAAWNVSSGGGQTKNSLAPARMASRIMSGSLVSATTKMPTPGADARSRSMVDIADDMSPRASTMARSGCAPSRASVTLTGIAPDRSRCPT